MLNARLISAARAYARNGANRHGLRGYRTDTGQTTNKPITFKAQPSIPGDHGTPTLRARQNGGRSLPLPPILDPVVEEAKERHREPRPHQLYGPRTKMQAEIDMNPFAQALATPVRQCQLTSARLPSHFLQPLAARIQSQAVNSEPSSTSSSRLLVRLVPEPKRAAPDDPGSVVRNYLLAHRSVFDLVTTRARWPVLLTERMKAWIARKTGRKSNSISAQKDVQWDTDTGEQVLVSMRERVHCEVSLGIRHKYVLLFSAPSDMQTWHKREKNWRIEDGPVTSLLALQLHEDEELTSALRQIHPPHTERHGEIEIYNLAQLLGKEEVTLGDLGASWALMAKGAKYLAVLESTRSVELRLAIMTLEAYLRT
ncbi:hypothetical protein LTR35_014825 [Friedmanniomyces endolithicus]|uniref:Uncharacterized protein n=1 Tax=Friedmanniomyces endolithicus TaxID=329885 RepID=A0AAN6J7U6_9PEZI|nr:hypothetical protein LTR35_014825 [Friedmanniomyces endolithicus]KAK0279202.1 hypothetical protein LTS00_013475 [Friedmanniomyces endolithicus]KAK0311725.1 hypothetical protein LTR82_014254 [Friedmanniomyces endolithicus]KAK0984566.1 hypothetical protein LTR54_014064 [Friedmanniomyces endolithicus]